MIIVEDRFDEITGSLPAMSNPNIENDILHEVKFGFGDDKELMSYLIANRGEVYPLVWLVTPFTEYHELKYVKTPRLSFILATPSNSDYLNRQRFETNYKNVLIPLYNNFVECIRKSNIINAAEQIEVIKYPNYSNEKLPGNRETLKSSEKHKTFDIWDAIKITISCNVNNKCYRGNIKFRANQVNYENFQKFNNAGWIYIEKCYVDKNENNCDNFLIEINDVVYFKDVFDDDGRILTIIGWKYTGGDKSLLSSYEKIKNLS